MPEEIIQELKQQNKKPKSKPPSKSAFDALMAPKLIASPKSKKRGRPPKNDPRFIKKSVKTTTKTNSDSVQNTNKLIHTVLNNDMPSTSKEIENYTENKTENPENTFEVKEEIKLNDKSDLRDVRALFREWIRTCKIPSEDDISMVREFLIKLLKSRQDDYVYSALKTLCIMCQETNDKHWSNAYNDIVQNVQNTFQSLHKGKKLYIPI